MPPPALPGSGSLQTSDNFVAGSTLWQSFWRGDQGWSRTVPIVNGQIQWVFAEVWSGPILLSNLPGSGSMQTGTNFVVGATLWQTFYRGDQGWLRTVPIVNGDVQWGSASAWSGPYPIGSLPGSGSMQTETDYVVGSTLVQSFWRGDQGWYRTVPVVNGQIQWDAASAWSGPILLSNLPGSGSMQAQGDFVIGSVLWQTFWRGEQGWTRTVPIVNGQVMWEAASNWSTTQSIAFWRGGDREGGRRRSVNAGAGPREHTATTASENTTVVATPGDGTTKYYYLGGKRVAMSQNGTVYYLHGDHLGSTNVVSGAAISQQTYYAYGLPRTTEGTLPTDYAFTGQRQDASDGLLYYGARYYDPYLNRWTQPDSIIPDWYNPQDLNRFSYGLNNPVKYSDPTGHCPFCVVALGVPLSPMVIGTAVATVAIGTYYFGWAPDADVHRQSFTDAASRVQDTIANAVSETRVIIDPNQHPGIQAQRKAQNKQPSWNNAPGPIKWALFALLGTQALARTASWFQFGQAPDEALYNPKPTNAPEVPTVSGPANQNDWIRSPVDSDPISQAIYDQVTYDYSQDSCDNTNYSGSDQWWPDWY